MRRVVPLLLLVLLAAALVFSGVLGDGNRAADFRPDRVRHVEERLFGGDREGAETALGSGQGMNASELAYCRAVLALSGGDAEGALALARDSRAEAPSAWRPLSIEIAALMALERDEELGRVVREALEAMPDDERVLAFAAQRYATSAAERDPRRSLDLLQRIDALEQRAAPEGDRTAVRPESLLQVRYAAAMAVGAYGTARSAAEGLLQASGTNRAAQADAYALLGEAARLDDDLVAALDAYRRAVQLAPDRHVWQEHLVQLLLDVPGAEQEVLDRTSEMLRAWPTQRSVRVLRARALVRSEQIVKDGPDRAAVIYRRLLQADPDDLEVLRNLALLLYDWKLGGKDGTYLDDAHALLQRYVLCGGEIDEKLRDPWERLQARAREAAASGATGPLPGQEAFEADPSDVAAADAYRAALLAAGRTEDAGVVVRKLLEAAPGVPDVQALAARHFFAEGPDHDAVATLHHMDLLTELLGGEQALSETLLWMRCRALLEVQRHTEALADARVLLGARPAAVPYLEVAARAALAGGHRADAEAWLRQALAQEDRADLRELLERAIAPRDE